MAVGDTVDLIRAEPYTDMEVSLRKLLAAAGASGESFMVGEVGSRTRADVGFNIRLTGVEAGSSRSRRCYLHTGPGKKGLTEGENLFLLVEPSKRVSDRLDVTAYTPHSDKIFAEIASLDEHYIVHFLAKIAPRLTESNWHNFWHSFIERPEIVVGLKQGLEHESFNGMMRAQPFELVPDFLPEVHPSLVVLKKYLRDCYDVEAPDRVARVEEYVRRNEDIEAHLTLTALFEDGFPDGLDLLLGKLESSGFVSGLNSLPAPLPAEILPLVWEEWVKRPIEQLAEVEEGLPDALWRELSASCPDQAVPDYIHLIALDAPLLWSYVSRNHESLPFVSREKIRGYIVGSSDVYAAMSSLSISVEDVPKALNYFLPAESVIWDFIELRWDLISPQDQRDVRAAIHENNYLQAQFLLYIVDKGAGGDSYPMPLLGRDVDKLVSQLFHSHSENQTRIAKTVFMDCPVKTGFSACEASMAPNKNLGQPVPSKWGEQKEFNYWCRRSPCDSGGCLVNYEGNDDDELSAALPPKYGMFTNYKMGGQFYTLIKRYWGYQKTVLHDQKNGAFIRPLAAINRWNEVVDRLHCGSCEAPLKISEHSPNSINKMAYSVTYWHCGDTSCSEYARSVKLSHCQGSNCDKIIDSREDKHACNPWEVRSYKKMYFCSKCGSCCPSHAKSKGYSTCPGCGRADGYASPPDGSGRMTCIHCDHRIVIPWDKRESVRQGYADQHDSGVAHDIALGISTQFVLPMQFLAHGTAGCLRLSSDTVKPVLYVYDLFACMKHGFVKNLSGYQKIYDVKALEKLHYLGKFHPRYGHEDTDSYGLLKHLASVSSQDELESLGSRVWKYLENLLQVTEGNRVLNHYEKVELPYTLALFSLLGTGIEVDRDSLSEMTSNIELARNKLVEALRSKGIDTPTRDSLRDWLPHSDSSIESAFVMDRIDHIDFKSVRHVDRIFDAFYRIEKLERIGDCIKGISGYTGYFVPDYQVIGTNTLRCTSKKPNLLSFPKQLRPIVKAANGKCIVECDYAQMEVGISAALAEDELLIDDYNSGDVYSALGVELGIDRDRAKLVFLAILYGIGDRTLQVWLQKDQEDVRQIMQNLFTRYSGLERYQADLVIQGESLGFVESVSGVRRSVGKNDMANVGDQGATRAWEANWFKNYPVQASAATVFKLAVIEVAENVEPREFKLIAPLYDAIVFEVPLAKKDFYTELVTSAMKRAMNRYFTVLDPQVSVNDHDVSCWNGGDSATSLNEFLSEASIA